MLAHEFYLLVTCMASLSSAIRVDWNTNKGPIVPPTARTTVRPQPPFREPAAVWEPQHNDTPNPNPYVYVLPPPSRPRPATNNYLTADRQPVSQSNYDDFNSHRNYGSLQSSVDQYGPAAWNAVPGLGVKYVPNVGKKYYAVVPGGKATYSSAKPAAYYFSGSGGGDKPQGKYNAKTKKYKVYEKPRHAAPQSNYYHVLPSELPEKQHQKRQQLEHQHPYDVQWLATQQLPVLQTEQPFRLTEQHHEFASEKHANRKLALKTKKEDRLTASSAFSLPNAVFSNTNKLS